jgi:hypothetical protein
MDFLTRLQRSCLRYAPMVVIACGCILLLIGVLDSNIEYEAKLVVCAFAALFLAFGAIMSILPDYWR